MSVYLSRGNTEIDALFTIYIFLLFHRNPIEVLQHGQYSFESDIYRLAMSIYEFYRAFDIHSMDPMANQLHCTPFCNIENDEVIHTCISFCLQLYNSS